jgi:threonine/homoserine/homoserine lactone efflux protein
MMNEGQHEQERLPQTRSELEDDVCVHVFRASANLLGVCLTMLGLLKGLRIASLGDNFLLMLSAAIFLSSCLISYIALRTRRVRRRYRMERIADLIFIVGLCLIVLVGALLAYEVV